MLSQPSEADFYAAVTELLKTLHDDHTNVRSPTERAYRQAGRAGERLASYGFLIQSNKDARYVARVLPDSPASLGGVQVGWEVVSIAGGSPLIAGSPVEGREDRIEFRDEDGRARSLNLVARILPPYPHYDGHALGDGVAYIRFDRFTPDTLQAFSHQMRRFVETPPKGLILDLRSNGGGELNVFGRMQAFFHLEKQTFAVMRRRFVTRSYSVNAPADVYEGPLLLLVGPSSASAAELFAGGLQETGRAVVIGETTRGAVVGTRTINLPDGGSLNVGMLAMTTGGGRTLEKIGVTPDIVVPTDWMAVREGRDPALEVALAWLNQN